MIWYIILTIFAAYFIYKWMNEYFSPLYDIPEPPRYGILRHLPYFLKSHNTVEMLVKWGEQFKDYGFYKIDPVVGKISFAFL